MDNSLNDLKSIIDDAKRQGANHLDFSNLNISTEELSLAIDHVKEIFLVLKSLNLNGNNLVELPSNIGDLTNLSILTLFGNDLSALPETFGNLSKLKELNLNDNNFATLPEFIGKLTSLETLLMASNGLTAIPDTIVNLTQISEIDFSMNKLNELPASLVNSDILINTNIDLSYNNFTVLPDLILALPNINTDSNDFAIVRDAIDLTQEEIESNEISRLEEERCLVILSEIYKDREEKTNKFIGILKLNEPLFDMGGTRDINTGELERKTGKDVMYSFFSKITFSSEFEISFYLPAVKHLIENALSNNDEERNNTLFTIDGCLGVCETPMKDLLMKTAIQLRMPKEGNLPIDLKNLLVRESVEIEILDKLRDYFRAGEKVEQIQGLTSSIFQEQSEIDPDNRLKILGERFRLPAKSVNAEYFYTQLPVILAENFAKIFCKLDTNNVPIINEGCYQLKDGILETMFEKHKASFGLEDGRQAYLEMFEDAFKNLSSMKLLGAAYDNKNAIAFINPKERKEQLHMRLINVPPTKYRACTEGFILKVGIEGGALAKKEGLVSKKRPTSTKHKTRRNHKSSGIGK